MADIIFRETMQLLERFAKELSDKIRQNIDDGDINASWNLYNSVDTHIVIEDPSGSKSVIRVVLNLEEYWRIIEEGRKPGRFPPVESTRHWIQIKPIPPREDDMGRIPTEDQLTFLIGRKIARDGIKPRPFVSTAIDELLSEFYAYIEETLAADVSEQLQQIFDDTFKARDFKTINIK